MGMFTGREVASKKSVTRFLLTISELMLPNSSLEEDKEELEEVLLTDMGSRCPKLETSIATPALSDRTRVVLL